MKEKTVGYLRNRNFSTYCVDEEFIYQCNDKDGMVGFLGRRFHEILQSVGMNMKYIQGEHRDLGEYHPENGTWDGISGVYQRKEVDFFCIPIPFAGSDRPFEYGIPLISLPHRISSAYNLTTTATDIRQIVHIFDPTIWFTFGFTIIAAAFALSFLSRQRVVSSLWDLFRFLPGQGNFSAYTSPQIKVMVTTFSLGIFLLVDNYFCNLMSTDKVATDVSIIAETLDDILRIKLLPYLLKADPLTNEFKNCRDPTSPKYKIWQNVKDHNYSTLILLEQKKSGNYDQDGAVFAFKLLLELFLAFRCTAEAHEVHDQKQWMSKTDLDDVNLYFFRAKNMSREMNQALDDLTYRLPENGIMIHHFRAIPPDFIQEFLQKSRNRCLRENMGQFMEDVKQDISRVTLKDVTPLFVALGYLIAFAAIILGVENLGLIACTRHGTVSQTLVEPIRPLSPTSNRLGNAPDILKSTRSLLKDETPSKAQVIEVIRKAPKEVGGLSPSNPRASETTNPPLNVQQNNWMRQGFLSQPK